jgi:hypothetical protein
MYSSHRNVFGSVAVAALFLFIIHLTFKPLTSVDLRALVDEIYHTGASRQKELSSSSSRYVMLLLFNRIGVCVDMTMG